MGNLFCPEILKAFEREYAKKKKKKPVKRRKSKKIVHSSPEDSEDSFELEERPKTRKSTRARKSVKENYGDSPVEYAEPCTENLSDTESDGWTCNICKLYEASDEKIMCLNCDAPSHIACLPGDDKSKTSEVLKHWVCDDCLSI